MFSPQEEDLLKRELVGLFGHINKMRREQAPEAAAPTPTEALLTEIRDELKARPNG